MKNIAIFCGGNPNIDHKYVEAAKQFVEVLVEAGMGIVYGGGGRGIMGVIADRMIELNGDIIGVTPVFLANRELAHKKVKNMHVVNSMAERKKLIFDLADGFVMLPGGVGTLDEFFEAITNAQIGLHKKPCGVLNVDNYFNHLLEFMEVGMQTGFVDKHTKEQMIVSDIPEILLSGMMSYEFPQKYRNIFELNKAS